MSGFSNGIILPNVGTTGAPTAGSHAKNELWVDSNGVLWVCSVAGTPGTWINASAVGDVTSFNTRTGAVVLQLGDVTAVTAPGALLASQLYAPGVEQSIAVTATTLTALDTTNWTLPFTVPASGNVDIDIEFNFNVTITASLNILSIALLNHSGGAQIGNTKLLLQSNTVLSDVLLGRMRFHLTGLTPGALQIDIAASYTSGTGSAATVYAQGNSGTITNGKAGPLLIQAFAA